MTRLLWLAFFLFLATGAEAQNTTCALRPVGDDSNACASTSFLWQFMTGSHTGTITPNNPVIGNAAGNGYTQGTRAGNTTNFATVAGTIANGHCRSTDANGNDIDAGGACTIGGGGGTVTSGTAGQYANYNASGNTVVGNYFPVPIAGASGSAQNTTANCTASSTSVTLTAAIDFANGQGISLEHCGAAFTGTSPTSVTVASTGGFSQGPAGTTTYAYQVSCVDNAGGVGAAVAAVTITNGAATLGTLTRAGQNLMAYNTVSWTNGGSCPGIAVWRNKSSGGYQLVGIYGNNPAAINNQVYDTGQTATIAWVPATPPGSALADRLVTTISSGGGTTSLVVGSAATTNGTGIYTRHDDTAALNTYLAAVTYALIPPGTYEVESITIPNTIGSIVGSSVASSRITGWTANQPTLTGTSLANGITFSNLVINTTSQNADALDISSTNSPQIVHMSFSGLVGVNLTSVQYAEVSANAFTGFTQIGVQDTSGLYNNISGNNYRNCIQVAACLFNFLNGVNGDLFQSNIMNGPGVFGIDLFNSSYGVIRGNVAHNLNHESYHIGGSANNEAITGNYAEYGGGTGIDYCISVSNDTASSVNLFGTVVAGNTLIGCGTSAIAIAQLGGTSVSIADTMVSGNRILFANQAALGGQADIILYGSGVSTTYVNSNTHGTGSAIAWDVAETNIGGLPTATQVGAEFGIAAASGKFSLSGAGSAVLTAGSTGL